MVRLWRKNIVYFVYILWSKKYKKTYVGFTNNVERRLIEHNSGGSYYTKRYMPWEIIKIETFDTMIMAKKRELYLKSSSGRRIIMRKLIVELS